jgi:hypothetical protein
VEVDADRVGEPLVEDQRVAPHVDLDLDGLSAGEVESHEGVDRRPVALRPDRDRRPVARSLLHRCPRLDDHHATGVVHSERHGLEERQGQEAVHGAELRRKASSAMIPTTWLRRVAPPNGSGGAVASGTVAF